jgi:hemin uptake protein HemP
MITIAGEARTGRIGRRGTRMSGKTETPGPSKDAGRDREKAPENVVAVEKRGGPTRYFVSELMRGEREVILEHRGQDYRLRITEAGKLILSK